MGSIFNPSGGGTERESTLTGGQSQLLNALTDLLTGQVGQGVTPFQGVRPSEVPFSPLQQQGFGLASQLTPGISSGFNILNSSLSGFDPQQSQGFLDQAGGALSQGLQSTGTQAISDAFAPSRQLATNQFQRKTVPRLLEQFGATSGSSGALNQALAEAGADLSLGLRAQEAPFIGQAALNAPGQQFQGAGLAGQFAGIPGQLASQGSQLGGQATELLSQLFNIGGLQQQLPRGQASAEQDRFLESQAFANPFLSQFLGPALGTSAFQAFQKPSGPSPFSQVSGALGGSGAFGTQGAFGPLV